MKATMMVAWVCLVLFNALPVSAASPYSVNAFNAVYWLSQHQNSDGSWGAGDDIKLPATTEAVMAMQALNQRIPAYYWGVAWLENHSAPNIDYKSRRILALAPHGDNVQGELAYLQTVIQAGNNSWGLTSAYQGAAMDSALALLACSQLGVSTNVQKAFDYLIAAQFSGADSGWPIAQESISDPATTALVVQALNAYKTQDARFAASIVNGVNALSLKVSSASPPNVQALAALAYLRAGYSDRAVPLLNMLAALQNPATGSWSADPYTTALAARAMAASMGSDLAGLSDRVSVLDPNLRAAINRALGRNSMDALSKGDMANLTTLNAAGLGITNLTGLEWAVNLTSLDLRNNNITSTTQLAGLTNLTVVQLTGNPVYSEPPVAVVPALSFPSLALACGLLMMAVCIIDRKRRNSN